MSLENSTSYEDVHVLNTFHYVVSIILFILLVPAAILYGICIVALLFAKGINYQMRVLLINIFIVRFSCILFPQTIEHIGFAADIIDVIVCKIYFCLIFIGYLASLTSITLFSVMVYLFIKYDNKKLKWYIIIPSITVSWMASVLFGVVMFTDSTFIDLREGFCIILRESMLFIPYIIFAWVTEAVLLTVILVFSVLTICFVRRRTFRDTAENDTSENDTSQSNPRIKIAITKVLVYLLVASFMDFIGNLLPSLTSVVTPGISTLLRTFKEIFIVIPPVLTPIVMVTMLKPVLDALNQAKVYLCSLLFLETQ